ncbi:MAG: hypothetical protein K5657_05125 [Desulfovibrio sp.]|nr:hypothetical protein [Desulfovibrio sp.]
MKSLRRIFLCSLLFLPFAFALTPDTTSQAFFSGGGVAQPRMVGTKKTVKQRNQRRGNPQTRVYHNPTCSYFKSKSATILFNSPEEARRHGFRPCSKCGG